MERTSKDMVIITNNLLKIYEYIMNYIIMPIIF